MICKGSAQILLLALSTIELETPPSLAPSRNFRNSPVVSFLPQNISDRPFGKRICHRQDFRPIVAAQLLPFGKQLFEGAFSH